MVQSPFPLAALSEEQRAQALQRYNIIRPALEKEISQAQVARTHEMAKSTVQLWIKQYREKGLAGLVSEQPPVDVSQSGPRSTMLYRRGF